MCGIAGIYAGSQPVNLQEVEAVWVAIADRGTHAAGFAFRWADSDSDIVFKRASSSRELVKQKVFSKKVGGNLAYALLHTRFTTQGSTANNGNNHPIVGHDIILTHNGVISNDDLIFRELNVNRLHQVDTECINAGLRHKNTQWITEKVQGSMSIAWVDTTQNQQEVHLITNGRNPLVIGRTVEGHVVWASNKYHLEDSFNMKSTFNATPYKKYTISQGINEPVITSEFVSDRRENARVLFRGSHAASWGDIDPTPTKNKKKPKKGRLNARKHQKKTSFNSDMKKRGLGYYENGKKKGITYQTTLIEAGYVYDIDSNSWRKAKDSDYENAYEL